jgi:pilus assembly protein FimV
MADATRDIPDAVRRFRQMRYRIVSSACAAAMLAVAATAAGQNAPQAPAPSPAPGSTQSAPAGEQQREAARDNEITVIGCVAREGDAASNEFVLRNASMAPAAGASAAAGAATKPGGDTAVGTTGAGPDAKAAAGRSFALTGDRESSLATYVGQRVEIVGRMAPGGAAGVAGAAGAPAARGGDAGAPAPGAGDSAARPGDAGQGAQPGQGRPAGQAGTMPELTIVSVKPAAGSCD